MQGVKALDPAFLMTESIGININHPLNFSSILDDLSISGAYYEPSVDNIDCLDDILRCILKDAMRWDPLPFSYKKAVKELEERRDYFRERFKGDKSKKIGLSRLQKGVQVYINYLKEYIETEFYELGKFRNREEEKALSMIRWEDNLHFSV